MKFSYQGMSVEIPVAPVLFNASSWLRAQFAPSPLRQLRGQIALVSSRLFAVAQGTVFRDQHGDWKALPLLKAVSEEKAIPVNSGFAVTGLYDVFGQLAVAHALGELRLSFTLINDEKPPDLADLSLICFGSPSSNRLSGEVFQFLESVVSPHMSWAPGYNGFRFGDELFQSGADAIVVGYSSPWSDNRSVLVASGVGPAGTQAGAKLLAKWEEVVPSRRQRKVKQFLAVVSYVSAEKAPVLRRFVELP